MSIYKNLHAVIIVCAILIAPVGLYAGNEGSLSLKIHGILKIDDSIKIGAEAFNERALAYVQSIGGGHEVIKKLMVDADSKGVATDVVYSKGELTIFWMESGSGIITDIRVLLVLSRDWKVLKMVSTMKERCGPSMGDESGAARILDDFEEIKKAEPKSQTEPVKP